MTDKETLILAAKAAGKDLSGFEWYEKSEPHEWAKARGIAYAWGFMRVANPMKGIGKTESWNPFESSGDCFRMETALSIDIEWSDVFNYVYAMLAFGDTAIRATEYFADHNGDKDKARRYASTRAAALIGEKA